MYIRILAYKSIQGKLSRKETNLCHLGKFWMVVHMTPFLPTAGQRLKSCTVYTRLWIKYISLVLSHASPISLAQWTGTLQLSLVLVVMDLCHWFLFWKRRSNSSFSSIWLTWRWFVRVGQLFNSVFEIAKTTF